MMQRLAYSSEFYYIKAEDLQKISVIPFAHKHPFSEEIVILLINPDGTINRIQSPNLTALSNNDYIKTRIAYYSHSAFISLLLTLIKPIKRRFYIRSYDIFRVRLSDIINADLPRGERNETNAYQLNNKRWYVDPEEAHKRYEKLKNSIKKRGYDYSHPLFVMLNRKFGVKDQILQGHHRIGICKDLKIEEVSISFWTAPATFNFFKKILNFIKKNKN